MKLKFWYGKMDGVKWFRKALALTLVCVLVLCGCSAKEDNAGTENQSAGQSGQENGLNDGGTSKKTEGSAGQLGASDSMENFPDIDITFTDRDMDSSYDINTAATVEFRDDGVQIQGDGVQAEGTTVTISREGAYVLRGNCSDGRIIINAGENDKIQLVLDGLRLGCSNFAPLYIRQADKVFLTLAEGSDNSLQDGETYEAAGEAQAAEEDANVDGTIFSRADLTINGLGDLTVTGLYKHGIVSKDDLIVTGGQMTVKAAGGGMYGKDCVKIAGGTIYVESGKDAIQSDNNEKEDRGYVYIAGGSLDLNAGGDGIQAETVLQVDGGELRVQTGGGSEGVANIQLQSKDSASDSAKGLKAGGWLIIKGGTIDIDSADDALHSNGDVSVWDGALRLSTGDDGIHADGAATVSGGEIQILSSYEGIEGSTVEISGGDIWLTASDDGINAAGGSDGINVAGGSDGMEANNGGFGSHTGNGGEAGMKNGGRFGADQFQVSENSDIRISGGKIYINASGDGLDANGSLYISGGTVYVDGPTSGGDGALDYDAAAEVSGGTIVAVCSAGMAQGFSGSSSQVSILFQFESRAEAGQTFELADSQGNVLISHTPEKSYQVVAVSSPELAVGETYMLIAGEQKEEIIIEGIASGNVTGAGMPGGGRPGRAPGAMGENTDQRAPGLPGESASQEAPGLPGENAGQEAPNDQRKPGSQGSPDGERPALNP